MIWIAAVAGAAAVWEVPAPDVGEADGSSYCRLSTTWIPAGGVAQKLEQIPVFSGTDLSRKRERGTGPFDGQAKMFSRREIFDALFVLAAAAEREAAATEGRFGGKRGHILCR
jgi:hypothetical protein